MAADRTCPVAKKGLLFQPTAPASPAATISKMPLKPPAPSSTDSTGVAIPNAKTLIEYDAVALDWSANTRGEGPARGGNRYPGALLRAGPGPGSAEDCREALGPMHTRCLTLSY